MIVRIANKVQRTLHGKKILKERRRFAWSYFEKRLQLLEDWVHKKSEDSNFYYELEESNRYYLAHTLAIVCQKPIDEILGYFSELENDAPLRKHIESQITQNPELREVKVHYARRVAWYAFVRILKPRLVVETGVDHGVGSCVLSLALMKNKAEGFEGRYLGTEINPKSGFLYQSPYSQMGEIIFQDSLKTLDSLEVPIDIFINDSDHSAEYESQEYEIISKKLSPGAILLGDNSHVTDKLAKYSQKYGRQFLFFQEKPKDHWYPGAGIGISFKAK